MTSTIGSREDPLFSGHGVNTTLPSIYKCSIMLVLKGAMFLHDPLYSCTTLEYLTSKFCSFVANCAFVTQSSIRFSSLNPAHSFVIRSECSFREGCPQELAHIPSCLKRALNLVRVLSLLAVRLFVRDVSCEK